MRVRTAVLLASGSLLASVPGQAQVSADAAFEAALTAQAPTVSSAAGGSRYLMKPLMQAAAGPAGIVPAKWRTLKALPADDEPLQEAVDRGELDPLALMRQIMGPLPVPPNAEQVGCWRDLHSVSFTLGADLSPAFDRIRAESASGRAELSDVLDRAALDAKPTRDALRQFMTGHGLREFSRYGRRAGFIDERRGLRVEVEDSSTVIQRVCDPQRKTVRLPTGPTMRIEYGRGLGQGETWVTSSEGTGR